ncbi:hypothetical protein HIM_05371 [Hirsutella minnesotensis 3608]|uniref:Uncharacterized protein n=1 Tax=Hirsutella minnesotensis 3608 TaxID=1043627 RepID=A0A0F8A0A7_9HYPO|nr:hypothetical protein HIM_05371 [Hirsutella minnesotensis 3608]
MNGQIAIKLARPRRKCEARWTRQVGCREARFPPWEAGERCSREHASGDRRTRSPAPARGSDHGGGQGDPRGSPPYYQTAQPLVAKAVLPEQPIHNEMPMQQRNLVHENVAELKPSLKATMHSTVIPL